MNRPTTAKEFYQSAGPNYVRVFDTTLRDGRQAPDCAMSPEEVLEVARALDKARVDIIEVGVPIKLSKEQLDELEEDGIMPESTLAGEVIRNTSYSTVASFARIGNADKKEGYPDIDASADSIKDAILENRGRIALVTRTSKKRFLETAGIDYEKVKRDSIGGLRHTCKKFFKLGQAPDVQIYFEGASEAEPSFLIELGELLIKTFQEELKNAPKKVDVSKAELTLDICDTHGTAASTESKRGQKTTVKSELPELAEKVFSEIGIGQYDNIIGAIHCHNDFDRSTANTADAAFGQARQLDVTVGGIGERAANTKMTEALGNLHQENLKRAENGQDPRFELGVNLESMYELESLVYKIVFRDQVQELLEPYAHLKGGKLDELTMELARLFYRAKAFTGANIASSSAGIHLNLLKKNKKAYNTVEPEDYGAPSELLRIGPWMGRSGVELALYIENVAVPNEIVGIVERKFRRSGIRSIDTTEFVNRFIFKDPKVIEKMEALNHQRIKISKAKITEEWGEGLEEKELIECTLQMGDEQIEMKADGETLIGTMEKKVEEITGHKFTVPEGGYSAHSTTSGGKSPVITKMAVVHGEEIRIGFGMHGKNNGANLKAFLSAVSQFLKEKEEQQAT